jgi:hypothetical protein
VVEGFAGGADERVVLETHGATVPPCTAGGYCPLRQVQSLDTRLTRILVASTR